MGKKFSLAVCLLAVAVALGLVFVNIGQAPSSGVEEGGSARFDFSADPSKRVLSITTRGSAHQVTIDHVFADGRVTGSKTSLGVSRSRTPQRRNEETPEAFATYDDIVSLLLALEDYGFLSTTSEEIESEIADRVGHAPKEFLSDGATVEVTIELDSYTVEGQKIAPFLKSVECYGCPLMNARHPDLRGPAAFAKIFHWLNERRAP